MFLNSYDVLKDNKNASVLQLSPKLEPLNSCSYEKALAHHEKGRGILTENPFESIDHDYLLVFNFETGKPDNAPYWYRTQYVDRTFCWITGETEGLTQHHVIPKLYRKNFDPEQGLHSHNWIATVSRKAHDEAEKLNAELFVGINDWLEDLPTYCEMMVNKYGGWDSFRERCAELWYKNKPIYNPRGYFKIKPW